jgi:hypothetical protein
MGAAGAWILADAWPPGGGSWQAYPFGTGDFGEENNNKQL